MNNQVNEWIADLCQAQGLGNGSLDENGQWSLITDDGMSCGLYVPADSEMICFVAELGPIPSGGREEFFARLLEANFLFQATGGAALSIDQSTATVWLNYTAPIAGLDSLSFGNSFGSFLERAMEWRLKLDDPAQAETSSGLRDNDSNEVMPGGIRV
jgi:hypothetical protein